MKTSLEGLIILSFTRILAFQIKEDSVDSPWGGCQNYGPFLDPYYNTAPTIWGTQKGTIILTTTYVVLRALVPGLSHARSGLRRIEASRRPSSPLCLA